MRGMFELFTGSDSSYRFQLTAPDGTVMAVSKSFPDKRSAIAGIAAVREYAGMGLVTEIPVPAHAVVQQSVTVPLVAAAREPIPEGMAGGGEPEGVPRRPRFRIPSAAHLLGQRAVTRNRRSIMRWRQTSKTGTVPAGLSPC